MARPTDGPVPRTKVVSVRVTQAEYAIITAGGIPPTGFMRMLLDRAMAESGEVQSPQESQVEPWKAEHYQPAPELLLPDELVEEPIREIVYARHRHKRERTGDQWTGGVNVGTWRCSDCLTPLDP